MTENPFQFGAANDLSPKEVLDYYIEDFNYSRSIQSKRNVFLLGERGSGKTMTLLYHSLAAQRRKAEKAGAEPSLDWVGVYVPCNTPLTHRREYELLPDFKAAILSEHFLVLSITHHLATSLNENRDIVEDGDTSPLADALGYSLGKSLPDGESLFERVLAFTAQEIRHTQHVINSADSEAFYRQALSFSTLVMPFFEALRRVPVLSESHFLLMIDDAHDLNGHQVAALNSWIAYRDHSIFSFKVATTKVSRPPFITATGGSILEGHDFTVVDLEKPIQSERSDFGSLARRIVERRLQRVGCDVSPDTFFPLHPGVEKELDDCKQIARKEALERYPPEATKKISDHIYKYHRAIYFRRRASKANRPNYSGFKMLVYLSTGVVRNLLEPCFWMYDLAVSESREAGGGQASIRTISPTIQNQVIMEQSEKTWSLVDQGLDKVVPGCTAQDAEHLRNLFRGLAGLFRERLLKDISEPRAVSFSISARNEEPNVAELDRLLLIARKATILYARSGAAKDAGAREYYYVPNRMLWPVRGLDPQGQHARVSLPASILLGVAKGTAVFDASSDEQRKLF
ncbi:MAG: hypothetical protein OXK79_01900 [Chloroflexota bacterium]|nr:hypothetical protein [Chloroflexota bacterium]